MVKLNIIKLHGKFQVSTLKIGNFHHWNLLKIITRKFYLLQNLFHKAEQE